MIIKQEEEYRLRKLDSIDCGNIFCRDRQEAREDLEIFGKRLFQAEITICVNALKVESELQVRETERRHEKSQRTSLGDEKIRRATKIHHLISWAKVLIMFLKLQTLVLIPPSITLDWVAYE